MYHAYQWQTGGVGFWLDYAVKAFEYGTGAENPLELPAYVFGEYVSVL